MSNRPTGVDLSYRPKGYFWPMSLKTYLMSSIKGADRRRVIAGYVDDDRLNEVPPAFLQSALPEPVRILTGRLHPSAMGGEYLPDLDEGEIEIARITLDSTTQDVTSLRARRHRGSIKLRVVDEYDGMTLTDATERSSEQPITLGELVEFFLGSWDLLAVLEMNFSGDRYPSDEVHGFFWASSEFYPDLDWAVRQRVEVWLRDKRGPERDGNDEE